jgi:hypothetical protein
MVMPRLEVDVKLKHTGSLILGELSVLVLRMVDLMVEQKDELMVEQMLAPEALKDCMHLSEQHLA